MELSNGIDIIDVSRIKNAIENINNFKNQIFSQKEILYCENKKSKYQSYSVRFAAKEAFLKAIGTGWGRGISWTDIEILNDDSGKPFIILYNAAKEIFEQNGFKNISVSLSHTENTAIASVILSN